MSRLVFALLFLVAACSGPAAERTAITADALAATPQSGFLNTQIQGLGNVCATWVPSMGVVSVRACNLSDPNQNWGVYSMNAPGSFGVKQMIYLKSSGNPATNLHAAQCWQATGTTTPIVELVPCDTHTADCSNRCALNNTCTPGTTCTSTTFAVIDDFVIDLSGEGCVDPNFVSNVGGQLGSIPVSLAACDYGHTTTHGGWVPFGFVTAFMLDAQATNSPFYVQWAGGVGGQPSQWIEEPSSTIVRDFRNQPTGANQIFTILLDLTQNANNAVKVAIGSQPSQGCTECGGSYQNGTYPQVGTNNTGAWAVDGIRYAGTGSAFLAPSVPDAICLGVGDQSNPPFGVPLQWRDCTSPGNGSWIHLNPIIK